MRTKFFVGLLALVFALFLCSPSHAAGHGEKQPMKKGILLVAFGSTIPAAQASFANIDKKVKAAFPEVPVRWAYTSHIIRKKLAKQGRFLDSPEAALAKMLDEGYTHVAVQSLHTIGGSEYHDLGRIVGAFKNMGGFQSILLGYPLLATQEDMKRNVNAILKIIPQDRKESDAVVLMGHGTHHPSNAFYAALMFHLQRKDPRIFVGTVEGSPEIGEIRQMLLEKGIKKAFLMPFMSVAGDHAVNDMAGDEEDSWQSVLKKAGIECVPVLKGTAEFAVFVDIWVDHLRSVLSHF